VCHESLENIYIVQINCLEVEIIGDGVEYRKKYDELRMTSLSVFETIFGGRTALKDWNETTVCTGGGTIRRSGER
jgi:hypothetical protein